MKEVYFKSVVEIERLHRLFLDVLEGEIRDMQIMDINSVQALMLYNIAHDHVTIGELTNRGYYLGSNVSYNLSQMVKSGYLTHEANPHDRRSNIAKLSAKGLNLYDKLDKMFMVQGKACVEGGITASLKEAVDTLGKFEKFWIRQKSR